MSVQAGPIFKRYAANGIATVYAIPFKVMAPGDLQITLNDVLVTSGFTLGPLGGDSTSCTFDVAPLGDLLFQLVLPFQRLTDYQTNGDLLAVTLNIDLDRIWLALKQLIGSNDRSLATNISEPEGLLPLPLKAERALRVLAFDALGNPIVSNLTLTQLEEQTLSAAIAVEAAEASVGYRDQTQTYRDQTLEYRNETEVFAALLSDPWAVQPIGVPIPVWDHIAGMTPPPSGNPAYRYIKLTASDGYNAGVLTSESVSGSAPLVQAIAAISDAGSPLNGQSVRLINTERRALRAGSSGTVEADSLQGHWHEIRNAVGGINRPAGGVAGGASSTGAAAPVSGDEMVAKTIITDGVNGTPRVTNETRSKNIGATYYMRIR
jgi:hypothetical protein